MGYKAIASSLVCCGICLFHFLCNQKVQNWLYLFSFLSVSSSTRGVTLCYGAKRTWKIAGFFCLLYWCFFIFWSISGYEKYAARGYPWLRGSVSGFRAFHLQVASWHLAQAGSDQKSLDLHFQAGSITSHLWAIGSNQNPWCFLQRNQNQVKACLREALP